MRFFMCSTIAFRLHFFKSLRLKKAGISSKKSPEQFFLPDLTACTGNRVLFFQLKFIPGQCAACLQSPGRKFDNICTPPSPPGKTPGLEVAETAHSPSLFVGEDHIYFHPHKKTVDGIALFKNKAVERRGESFLPHKSHETLPKSDCKAAVAGKKSASFKVAEFHFQRS